MSEREDKDARRREILEKSLYVFIQNGFSNSSIEALARASGASRSELYRYFGGKKDLFCASISFGCREALKGCAADDLEAAPTVFLTELGQRMLIIVHSEEAIKLQRSVIEDLKRHPQLGQWMMQAAAEAAVDVLAPRLKLWNRQGRVRVKDPLPATLEFIESVTARFNSRSLLGVGTAPSRREIGRHLNAAIEVFLNSHAVL